jgi:hypothetical protein
MGMVGKRLYAPVKVKIQKVSGTSVTFMTTKDGGVYTVTWGSLDDMWTPCPSTVASKATPTDLKASPDLVEGTLYLSDLFLAKNKIAAVDPKWPTRLGDPPTYVELTVFPTSIILNGVELADDNGFTNDPASPIDLLDPNLVDQADLQKVSFGGGAVTLQVSAEVCSRFGVLFFEKVVEDALTTIKAARDPDRIARAWASIGTVVRELRRDPTHMRIRPDQLDRVRTLLPHLDLP